MSENITRQSSMPPIPQGLDPELARLLHVVLENINVLMGQQGDPLDAAARYRDLTRVGLLTTGENAAAALTNDVRPVHLRPAVVPLSSDQLGRPPVPTGLTAVGGFDQITLLWESPNFKWLGSTEVWRSSDNNLSNAVRVGSTPGTIYVDKQGGDETTKYYWIKHISRFKAQGAPDGPFNADPASARLALNVGHMISILSESYQEAHPDVAQADVPLLFVVRPVIAVGGDMGEMVDMGDGLSVFVPSGVYITRAAIARATITTAQIKELSADKIVTGTISAGETITVGGSINGGKDTYADPTPGWWLGADAGVYKFFIGDTTNFLRWTGDHLEVHGTGGSFDSLAVTKMGVGYLQGQRGGFSEDVTPSNYAAGLNFDDPEVDNYLCYKVARSTVSTSINNAGASLSVATPTNDGIVPFNHPDPSRYTRFWRQNVAFRVLLEAESTSAMFPDDSTSESFTLTIRDAFSSVLVTLTVANSYFNTRRAISAGGMVFYVSGSGGDSNLYKRLSWRNILIHCPDDGGVLAYSGTRRLHATLTHTLSCGGVSFNHSFARVSFQLESICGEAAALREEPLRSGP